MMPGNEGFICVCKQINDIELLAELKAEETRSERTAFQ